MADIEVGQNRATLTAINDLKKATPAAIAAAFKDAKNPLEGVLLSASRVGDASWTTITLAHGLATTPSNVQLTPTSTAAGLAVAAYWVTKGTTNVIINFGAAPANAASVTFDVVAFI